MALSCLLLEAQREDLVMVLIIFSLPKQCILNANNADIPQSGNPSWEPIPPLSPRDSF